MSVTGYKTSATCVLSIAENSRSTTVAARIVDIANDGARVRCERPLTTGLDLRLTIDGMAMREVGARVLSNEGNDGDGYLLRLKLRDGSWPYQVFVSLTTLAMAGNKKSAGPTPPCLEELGLKLGCTADDVEEAFSRKVRRVHPDRGGDVESFVRLRSSYLESLDLLGARR